MQDINTPCFWPIIEQLLCLTPHCSKKFRVPVSLQGFFILPPAVGKEGGRVLPIAVQLKEHTAREIPDVLFGLLKKAFKTTDIFGFEVQLYDACYHLKKFTMMVSR